MGQCRCASGRGEPLTPSLPDPVVAWALSETGGLHVSAWRRSPMSGGTVAARIERIDISVIDDDGQERTVTVVQKWTWLHEIAGLRAAQAVRERARAVPLLIAAGGDESSAWLITPFYIGTGTTNSEIPNGIFEALALLHAAYADSWPELTGIPVVDAHWWRDICLSYARGAVIRQAERRPSRELDRARAVLEIMAEDDRVSEVLEALPRSLLHGDVHYGNILVHDDESVLLDWGSARVGAPMLDLANVAALDSPAFDAYSNAWCRVTGAALDRSTAELGYRWAALQIPVQYLAWVVQSRPPCEVDAALDRAEAALVALRAC